AIDISVDGEQDGGADLAEAVEYALHAEVWRARRPHRTNRRRTERRNDRFGRVGDDTRHAIAGLDAGRPQRLRCARDVGAKVVPAERARRSRLTGCDDRRLRSALVQNVRGEVEEAVGEEARARHAIGVGEGAPALLTVHIAEIPYIQPELGRPIDRPAMKGLIALERISPC